MFYIDGGNSVKMDYNSFVEKYQPVESGLDLMNKEDLYNYLEEYENKHPNTVWTITKDYEGVNTWIVDGLLWDEDNEYVITLKPYDYSFHYTVTISKPYTLYFVRDFQKGFESMSIYDITSGFPERLLFIQFSEEELSEIDFECTECMIEYIENFMKTKYRGKNLDGLRLNFEEL